MRDIAVIASAQLPSERSGVGDEMEMILPVVTEVLARAGLGKRDVGFTISGSCDLLLGRPFSFITGLDAVGAWPPIEESHVEMDGAWALYEAWVRLQHGDIDTALVYCFGRSSLGDLGQVLALQLDPYYLGPLWPDPVSLAALQARAMLDAGICTEREMAEIAARSRGSAAANPNAQIRRSRPADELLREPYFHAPLRKHDCPPISDSAAAVVLAAGESARRLSKRPAWIRGIDHRTEPHQPGSRDLARSVSTEIAGKKAGVGRGRVDVAELHAPFSHQEVLLRRALELDAATTINPSGGALAANPMMVAGLLRIAEAARAITEGGAERAVAHATSGPCLQQNLVAVLEA